MCDHKVTHSWTQTLAEGEEKEREEEEEEVWVLGFLCPATCTSGISTPPQGADHLAPSKGQGTRLA